MQLMKMLSTFPSPKEEFGQTKGGIVLVQVSPTSQQATQQQQHIDVDVTYKDSNGTPYADHYVVPMGAATETTGIYSDATIRKAILLVRFVNLMKWWIRDTRAGKDDDASTASVSLAAGLPIGPVTTAGHESYAEMKVSAHYRAMFDHFLRYYQRELDALAAGTEGGDGSDDHERLVAHTQKLVNLIDFVPMSEIYALMATCITDSEVLSGEVDAEELRKRVELKIRPGIDLSDKQGLFDREIKRRVTELQRTIRMAIDTVEGMVLYLAQAFASFPVRLLT